MAGTRKKIALIIIFAIVLYLVMGVYADMGKVSGAISGFNWFYGAVLLLFTSAGYGIRSLKWDRLLKYAGVHLSLKQSTFVFLSGLSMIVTPGKVGELWKAWLIKDISGEDVSKTIPVVIIDRITDVLALVFLSLFGIFTYTQGAPLVIGLSLLCVVLILAIRSRRVSKKIIAVLEGRFSQYASNFKTMHATFEKLSKPKLMAYPLSLGALGWLCECVGFYYVIVGFGHSLDFTIVVFIFCFTSLIGGLSMIPGGIGLSEVSISSLLVLNGFAVPLSIGIALLVRLGTFWYGAALGLSVYALFKRIMVRPQQSENVATSSKAGD